MRSRTTEKHIQHLLLKGKTPLQISKELLKKKSLFQSETAFLNLCHFMYQAGLHQLIIQTVISGLSKKKTIPWAVIIEVLADNKIDISKETRQLFLKGIKEQKQMKFILTSPSCYTWHPEFQKWKLQAIDKINRKKNHTFIKLMEDLEFIQSQGVLKKEKEILKQLKKLYPDNLDIQEKWGKFQEKWGRQVIQQGKLDLFNRKQPIVVESTLEKKQSKKIFNAVQEILKNNPEKSYNFALLFSFIGYPRLAVNILENHLSSTNAKWLYIELLLQSKLYVNCLDFTDTMELEYKDDPNTAFALTYIRAQAYYGLGKKEKAKNILNELLKVKPNYRLIHVLLEQWKTGAVN